MLVVGVLTTILVIRIDSYSLGEKLEYENMTITTMISNDYNYEKTNNDTQKNDEHVKIKTTIYEIININEADVDKLTTLPGIGEKMAQNIVDYRNKVGRFKTIQDILNVNGIGEKKFESIKKYIEV